ncbi:MAG TPA: hypothetical protein VHO69_00055, partial [Phototrophicaceae bacterium]|nr:hypothetical protein [Phototrophicaceae bacterium]
MINEATETRVSRLNRMGDAMLNVSSISMALVAALPVLVMGFSNSMNIPTLLMWGLGALLIGWLIGIVVASSSHPRT